MQKKTKAVIFIVVGVLIALYFFTLGWAIVGGCGLGLVWAGIEILRQKDFQIVEEGLVQQEQDSSPYLEIKVKNLSNKSGEIFITANIYHQGQIITTITSNTLTVPPNEIGTLKAIFQANNLPKEELSYQIVKASIK